MENSELLELLTKSRTHEIAEAQSLVMCDVHYELFEKWKWLSIGETFIVDDMEFDSACLQFGSSCERIIDAGGSRKLNHAAIM